jgi:rhodanese-related sulfurtransferase
VVYGHQVQHDGRQSGIEQLLARAQASLTRVAAADLTEASATGALVVDIRPVEQRHRDGELPGALVIDRTVLEWRLDPTSPWRVPEADLLAGNGGRVVLVCNEGYSSSLAAVSLRDLGLAGATDLVGGFQAWAAHESVRRASALAAEELAEVGNREGHRPALG